MGVVGAGAGSQPGQAVYALTSGGVLLMVKGGASRGAADKAVNLQVGGGSAVGRGASSRGPAARAARWLPRTAHATRPQPLLRTPHPNALVNLQQHPAPTWPSSLRPQVPAAHALAASPALIACACAAGIVRLCAPGTLAVRATLPRPPPTAAAAAPTGTGGGRGTPLGARGAEACADAVHVAFCGSGGALAVGYADRSLVVWDVRDVHKVRGRVGGGEGQA